MSSSTHKRALLTGASSGLGRALALKLAAEGYEVSVVGRNEKALQALVAEKAAAGRIRYTLADLSKPTEAEGLVARALSAWPEQRPFTLLVNCAGFAVTGRVEDIPAEAWARSWQVNFYSAVALVQQVLPAMKQNRMGLICNVGSGVGRRAIPFTAPYCVAKAALHSFTESLRVEVAGSGICVQLFSPGPIASNFHQASEHYGKPIYEPPFAGKSPEAIAEYAYHAIEARKERVVLGRKASLAHHLNYWAPRFTDKLLMRIFRIHSPQL